MAKVWIELSPLLGLGWVFVFSIALCGGLGWWLDTKLGTGRKLFIGGAVFGMVIGFLNLYKVVAGLDGRKRR